MSIRPVDHTTMIPKTQEISRDKHIENMRHDNSLMLQQSEKEKEIIRQQSVVIDTKETESTRIKDEHKKQNQGGNGKQSEKDGEKPSKKKRRRVGNIGSNIDIRI